MMTVKACALLLCLGVCGCAAETMHHPIGGKMTIDAHVTVDIRAVKAAAMEIGNFVRGLGPAPKQMTPEMQSALSTRRDRFKRIQQLAAQGTIGDDNKGYVDILNSEPGAPNLAAAENKDRQLIIRTVARQNGLERAMPMVESIFAQVDQDNAKPGEAVQKTDGHWIIK